MPPDGRFPSLDEGVSFAERYGGTNAIALSLRLHRPVRTEPQHHYCAFLSGWYLCALPLRLSTQTLCLAIVTERESITRLHLTLLGLLSQTVSHRYRESLLSRTPEHPPGPPERTAAGGPPVPRAGDDREGGRGAAASVRGHSQVPQAEPLPNLQRALQRQPGGEGAPERRFFFGGDRCLRGRAAGLPFWAAGGKSRLPTRLGVWRGRGSGAILASRFKPPAFPPDRRRPLAPLRRERTGAPSLETPFC